MQVQYRNSQLKTINDSHQLYHALAYPLLFPTGSSGWHPQMESNGRPISLCEYMRYKIMHREQPTHVQRCERLALEFYCDAWAQVESRNLAFHQQACQQAKYQASSARAIFDQLSQDNARQIGVPVVLPASYPNSPRYYHNLYLDAIALPRRFFKPDLFITMTCNPAWDEITVSIPPRSHWKYHMDIGNLPLYNSAGISRVAVNRVFYLKLQALLDVVLKKKLFGAVKAYVYRIEWQVRL
jgi:hypothetical protein